jgi:hypothetical protein
MTPGDYRVLDEIQRYQEIKDYDAIFLWGYNYQANPPDNGLLTEYVENGGTLIICPDGSPDAKQDETKKLFDVSIKTGKSAGRVDWKTVGAKGRKIAKDIDFELFADASWTGLPWGYSYFEGAAPLVTANGRTVLAETAFGRGRVLWMGYNLPYFAAYKKSVPASTLFCNMIEYGLGKTGDADIVFFDKTEYGSVSLRAITKNPKPVWIEVSESFYPGWAATVNGRAAEVVAGQPPVMLVKLSGSTDYHVELKYKPTAAHYAGWACTLIFIILLTAWYSSTAFRSYADSLMNRVDL